MTWSSTKELLSPLENPERVLRSKRKLFDNPSLVEASSPESEQLFEIEEHVEEEVTEKMAETMEEYMSKTRENYGSGITRPTINQDTPFELKGQFLKELRDNTFSGSEHEDANEHIEKVLEIVDLFHIPKVTQDQIILRAFPVSLTRAANKYCPPARTAKKMEEINNFQQEPDESLFRAWEIFKELMMKCPQHYLTDMQEVILFYNGLDVLTRQILDSKGAIPSKTAADAKIAIQEMAEYSQKWHNGTSSKTKGTETSGGLAAIQAQLNNLRREIKKVNEKVYAAQCPIPRRLCNHCCDDFKEAHGAYIPDTFDRTMPLKEKDLGSFTLPCLINNICFNKALVDLEASMSVMPLSTYTNLCLGELSHTRMTIELADRTIKQPRGIASNVLVRIGKFIFPIDFFILDIPEDGDIPLILERPFMIAKAQIARKSSNLMQDLAVNETNFKV
ncbi:reverse transcriptase domain-containing protein [Tanacetum coccineum]